MPFLNPTSLAAFGNAGPITGPDAANFGYAPNTPVGQVPVRPMSTTDVVLTFTPTELRQYEATVVLQGAGECPTQTVILRGEGSNETLTWTPSALNYGFVNPGSEAIKEVVFTNPASVPIVLTQVTSTNSADFYHAVPAGSDATKLTIPGGSVPTPMKIACNPSQLGARAGTVTFSTGLTQHAGRHHHPDLHRRRSAHPRAAAPHPRLRPGRLSSPGNTTFSVQRKVNVQNVGSRPPMPDPTSNLYLGQVAMDGTPGQLPLFDLVPGAGTAADEFTVALGSPYNPTVGLQAIAGQNFVDLTVTLKPQTIGLKTATFTLYSNDVGEPSVTVNLTADVQQLPPCTFITSPAMANFGLVTPGTQKDLPITITNTSVTAGETCYLSGIELGAGSDLAFSIVGGNIVEKELQPQESFQVVVRAAPTGPTPTTLQTLTGQLVFNSTSAARPQASIPLRASVGPVVPHRHARPDGLRHGEGGLQLGLAKLQHLQHLQHAGDAQHLLDAGRRWPASGRAELPRHHAVPRVPPHLDPDDSRGRAHPQPGWHGAGHLPGGVPPHRRGQRLRRRGHRRAAERAEHHLPGGAAGPRRHHRHPGRHVHPGSPAQGRHPAGGRRLGLDAGQADGAGGELHLVHPVRRGGERRLPDRRHHHDELGQDCVPGFGCVAVNSKGAGGKLVKDSTTNLKFVKPTTPAVASVFARLVNVGTNGSGSETPLQTAVMALTPPVVSAENAGFLRADANLAVVIISDATDQSSQPVTYYQNLLVNVKGFQRLSYFTFSAITPTLSAAPTGCTYDETGANSGRYQPIVQYTSGVADEICNSNWAATLQNLGRTAFGYRTQFYLNNAPDQAMSQVVVRVNGMVIPGCTQEAGCTTWWYDAASNSIKFNTTATPQPGVPLEIQYIQSCF